MTIKDVLSSFCHTNDDGSRIIVEDFGGSGPNLMIAHATGFCARMYLPLALGLHHKYHCFATNARNHGGSTSARSSDANWETYASDILAAMDRISSDPWIGFGHSYGATALLLAEEQVPGRFESLYLYEPIVFDDDAMDIPEFDNPLSQMAKRRKQTFLTRSEAALNFGSKLPMASFDPLVLDLYLETGLNRGRDGKLHLACARDFEAEIYAHARCHSAYENLVNVRSTVHFVAGGTSLDFDYDHQQLLSLKTPNSSSSFIANLGHFGPFDDPAQVASDISTTLEGT